jgi:hypothetical protein
LDKRFIHQEDLGVADDGAAEGDPLTLATGEGLRFAVEVFFDLQDLGGIVDPLIDLRFREMADLEAERHVVIDGHVRIKGVALEDHRDIAVLRRAIVANIRHRYKARHW